MPTTDYLRLLRQYWGYNAFRGIQLEIIEQVCAGRDTLGLMPTGGGKSLTFQVATLAQEGLCVVISPLIALMRDQVQHLRQRGIKAVAVCSGMSGREITQALDNCLYGNYKFLYVSPERLSSESFCRRISRMKVCLLVVDECHCISQWGYDFRPAYLEIANLRELIGTDVPVLALTASATPPVVDDIMKRLKFREPNVVRMSFARNNLSYVVRRTEDKQGELIHILRRTGGSAIVYVRNRNRAEELAHILTEVGISAIGYHAGMTHTIRQAHEQLWFKGERRVMVATNAFGMGIDKPDVRIVVHWSMPDSPEAYFQEAGRAGRDGLRAYAVLLYNKTDRAAMSRHANDSFPTKDYIRSTYDDIQYYYQMAMGDGQSCRRDFDPEDFCRKFHRFPTTVGYALNLLTQAGYLNYVEEEDFASRVLFIVKRDELYGIREVQGDCERLVRALLRLYTGIFTDYAFIDEAELAARMAISVGDVCQLLLALSRAHVINYIPHRRTAYIQWPRPRLDSSLIKLPSEVYEVRKRQHEQRLIAMLDYAEDDQTCRSRLLLHYFGEKKAEACGICDNCLAHRRKGLTTPDPGLLDDIIRLLQRSPLTPAQLVDQTGAAKEHVAHIVRYLLETGRLTYTDGMLAAPEAKKP